jgi:hypothetical protein
VWVAMEARTKIVPVIQLGPRTLEMAYAVVHELRERMQREVALPMFSSDGLRLYFQAFVCLQPALRSYPRGRAFRTVAMMDPRASGGDRLPGRRL